MMGWIGLMNNIQACVDEIVLNDIVYSERYSLSEQLIPMIQEVNYQYVA